MIRALWPWGARGHWDQGLLTRAFEGALWPGWRAEEHLESRPEAPGARPPLPTDRGAIVVCSGHMLATVGADAVRRLIESLPWSLFIHSSDESLLFDSSVFRGSQRATWVQTPRPGAADGDRRWLLGAQCDTQELLRDVERRPLSARPLRWAFGGQAGNARRKRCVEVLHEQPGGDLLTTAGFAQGRPRNEHLRMLASAAIAPCPPGNWTPDTFRLYEAIEAGCLPICDRFSPMWPPDCRKGYWRHAIGSEPFPCVDDWGELPALLARFESDPIAAQHAANKAGAWWLGYKRQIVCDLSDDAERLSGERQPRHAVTILVPTSPIPSHPSTAGIEEAIGKVRAYSELRDAEILIMVDGVRPEQEHRRADYVEYARRLIDLCAYHQDFRGCVPLIFDEWTHQANMARKALDMVRTRLVLYVEHDTFPKGEIDWSGIFRALDRPDVNAVKLSIFDCVREEHRYLMLDKEPQDIGGVPLIRTMQWSQRPHVAKTDWYRRIIPELFGRESKAFIEDVLWAVIYNRLLTKSDPFEQWGLWLYAPDGDMTRSGTSNGRGDDPKYPMHIAYDGSQPQGAPRPGALG